MTQGPWPYQPPKPPLSSTDVVISVVALVVTVLVGGAGAVMGLSMLAFIDYCPPESCSIDAAVTAVMAAVVTAAVAVVIGLVVTIVRLVRRKPAWPFAIATLGACVVVLFFGAVGFGAAVGA